MSMHILNTDFFGHIMIPLDGKNTLEDEVEQFIHIKLEMLGEEQACFFLLSLFFLDFILENSQFTLSSRFRIHNRGVWH